MFLLLWHRWRVSTFAAVSALAASILLASPATLSAQEEPVSQEPEGRAFPPPASFVSGPPADERGEHCLLRREPTVERISARVVSFCGPITSEGAQRVRQQLDGRVRSLRIASLGGELDAPLSLAELVRNARIELVVDGPCMSGCASFVFVAAERRRVEDFGLLGLHNTANSALLIARNAFVQRGPYDRPLSLRAEREWQLYREARVDGSLLMEPHARIRPLCINPGPPNRETGETTYNLVSEDSMWFPSRAQWQAFGVNFEGRAPSSREDVLQRFEAMLPGGARTQTFVFDPDPLPQPWWSILLGTPPCTGRG